MVQYVFKEDSPIRIKAAGKADPQRLGEEIARNGKDPHKIEEAARDVRNPFHPHLEWDDAKAAKAHRLDQIGHIIRSIRIVDEDTGEKEPAFVSINDGDGRSYFSNSEIKRSADLQLALLKQAKRDLQAWQFRYKMLADLCADVDEIAKKIDRRIAKESRETVDA